MKMIMKTEEFASADARTHNIFIPPGKTEEVNLPKANSLSSNSWISLSVRVCTKHILFLTILGGR